MPSPIISSLLARLALTRRRALIAGFALAPVLIAAVIAGIVAAAAPASQPPGPQPPVAGAIGPATANAPLPPPAGLLVEVSGAVAHPGVYRVAKGERASAAIAAAGGLTADADPTRLPNMAARLKDGEQLKVPGRATPTTARAGTGTPRVAKVSLNAATEDQLATVPGFTPELAAAVIQYRTEFGGFTTTKELVDVLGMSAADYALARGYVTP